MKKKTFQDLDIIKSRTLFLKNNIPSGELVLSDPVGGDMYFTFRLRYVDPDTVAKTTLTSLDQFHAVVDIDARPDAITETREPIPVGTYGKEGKPLYLGIVVQPQIAKSGQHNVLVTFYTGKEVENGN